MPHSLFLGVPNHITLSIAVVVVAVVAAAALWSRFGDASAQTIKTAPSSAVGLHRDDLPAVLGVGSAAAALSLVIFALKGKTPIWDDGALVLTDRLPMTLDSVLKPYHEHLNAVPIVLWGSVVALVGPSSRALMAILLLTHVLLATGTAALLVARLGRVPGFALALPLALLGSAHYDLLMPYQIVFTIPLLCGLVAVWFSIPDERTRLRRLAVVLALAIGVASSNVGLFVIVGLGVWFLLDNRWRQSGELVPAIAVWLLWFVTYGRTGLNDDGLSQATTGAVVPYTFAGITSGLGGLMGLGPPVGVVILLVGLAWVVVRRPQPSPAFVGFALAIVALFAAGSLFRAYGNAEQATGDRYIYLTAYLLAFGVAAAAPRIANGWRLVPIAILAAGLNLIALAVAIPGYP